MVYIPYLERRCEWSSRRQVSLPEGSDRQALQPLPRTLRDLRHLASLFFLPAEPLWCTSPRLDRAAFPGLLFWNIRYNRISRHFYLRIKGDRKLDLINLQKSSSVHFKRKFAWIKFFKESISWIHSIASGEKGVKEKVPSKKRHFQN